MAKMVPVAGAADASGYMNFARLMGEGTVSETLRDAGVGRSDSLPGYLFQPLGMSFQAESRSLVPVYPPGLPALLAVGRLHEHPMAVRSLYALIGGVACFGMYFLATGFGLRPIWGFFSAVMLASSPLFLWSSLILMSDNLATAQAIWVVVFALWGSRRKGYLLLCGALLGWAVVTRLTSVLLLFPVLLVLLKGRSGFRGFAFWSLGGLPFLVFALWLNNRLYGGPFETGYGKVGGLFSAGYALPNLAHYLDTLWYAVFVGVLLGGVLALRRLMDGRVWILLSWLGLVMGFYAFYFFTFQTWWFMRFNLVAVPALIILGAVGFEGTLRNVGRWEFRAVLILAVAAFASLVFWQDRRSIFKEQEFEKRYRVAAQWAKASVLSESVVVSMQASGALYYYPECAVFRWDLASDEQWGAFKALADGARLPVFAILQEFEERDERSLLLRDPESWEPLGEIAPRVRAYRMVLGD